MKGQELLDLMRQAGLRVFTIGTSECGIIIALDLGGRLFAVLGGMVLNRVAPSAILGQTSNAAFLNPGGDVLWPAPEGTCYGYNYAGGNWCVQPAITGAVWDVVSQAGNRAVIQAEIDLINNRQLDIPCEFERYIKIEYSSTTLVQNVTETIRYTGTRPLERSEFLLAPWSLCQFDSGLGREVIMPQPLPGDIWDMYGPSESKRRINNGKYIIETETKNRFQLGISANIPWVEFLNRNKFRVRRYAGILPKGQDYIDISDMNVDAQPSQRKVNLSIYCDPSGFMEVEACGGCPEILEPGTELSVNIITEYSLVNN